MAKFQNNRGVSSMQTQLAAAKSHLHKIQNPYDTVLTDGEDHLNIYSGTSDLGRWLNFNSSATPLHHPVLGEFKTLQGFRAHISNKQPPDIFRRAYGQRLSQAIKDHHRPIKVDNFLVIQLDAAFIRLLSDEKRAQEFASCKLPLVAYYTDSGVRYEPKNARELIAGYKIIQRALRTKSQPDFTPIMNKPGKELYEDITPVYMRKSAEATTEEVDNTSDTQAVVTVPCALLASQSVVTEVVEGSQNEGWSPVAEGVIDGDTTVVMADTQEIAALMVKAGVTPISTEEVVTPPSPTLVDSEVLIENYSEAETN